MELLVLGGTHHVGRCVVEAALARGWSVTTLNRGLTPIAFNGATTLIADRTVPGALDEVVGDRVWDAVIDTWSGPPAVVAASASALAGRAGHYGYVSSRSVYTWPIAPGLDETGPVVEGDPTSEDEPDYAKCKRGAELAVLEAFGDRGLLARAGLILGPYEMIGRLPWWLRRLSRGGPTLAPGPVDRPLQYIDGRDLAVWMLDAAEAGLGGPFDTVSRPGHTTMGELLAVARDVTGGQASLVWVEPEVIESHGIEAWTELPIWLPPEGEAAGLHSGNTGKVHAAGLVCRPIGSTVRDTWSWLVEAGDPESVTAGRVGLDPAKEAAVLAAL
ncbi:MAG TPA: NAD-dependent epimerase/dehydratase family protein [Acidimicrobiales bacterium]|nr:NAD-dependent epimerase/dehydratase family protein [Acidimicrobiales bacterium]